MAAILFWPQCDNNAMYMPHKDIIKHYLINVCCLMVISMSLCKKYVTPVH